MKEPSIFKRITFSLFICLAWGCASSLPRQAESDRSDSLRTPPGLMMVPGQAPAPSSIRSIQLYGKGYKGNPPVIELGSRQKLILEFDELRSGTGQFRINFSHHDKDWKPSSMPEPWVFNGVNEMYLQGGMQNQFSKPDYIHYKMEFPNRELNFAISGNYMIHVFDYESNTELFSLPFFVTENEGEIATHTETVYNTGPDGAAIDQVFGKFAYPEFVEFPRYELSYEVVQNRFWKQAKTADQLDLSRDDLMEFHTGRDNTFPANFEFSSADLQNFSLQSPDIYSVDPSQVPPQVVLKDDFLNFTASPKSAFQSEYGFPEDGRDAQYGEVIFRLNTAGKLYNNTAIYLLGDFNQWTLQERNRLRYDAPNGYYETSSLIKEGKYRYKYVVWENGEIDPLLLNDTLTKRDQEYITLVYYLDPQENYYRILNTDLYNSR